MRGGGCAWIEAGMSVAASSILILSLILISLMPAQFRPRFDTGPMPWLALALMAMDMRRAWTM